MGASRKLDLNKLREGDEKALEEIARYLLPIAEQILRPVRSKQLGYHEVEAADIVQEVLVDVLRNRERLSNLEDSSQLYSYCYRLARNTALHRLRRHHPQIKELSQVPLSRILQGEPLESAEIEPEFAEIESRMRLEEAVSHLSERDRELIQAVFYEGQTTTEVAKLLGVSPATVRARMRRLMEELRQYFVLAGYQDEVEEQ